MKTCSSRTGSANSRSGSPGSDSGQPLAALVQLRPDRLHRPGDEHRSVDPFQPASPLAGWFKWPRGPSRRNRLGDGRHRNCSPLDRHPSRVRRLVLNHDSREQLMALNSLRNLFLDELKDLYDAEKQLLKALPKMAKASSAPEYLRRLRGALWR